METAGDVWPPYAREVTDLASEWGTDPSRGLTSAEAAVLLSRYGPNRITGEKPPSVLVIALTARPYEHHVDRGHGGEFSESVRCLPASSSPC